MPFSYTCVLRLDLHRFTLRQKAKRAHDMSLSNSQMPRLLMVVKRRRPTWQITPAAVAVSPAPPGAIPKKPRAPTPATLIARRDIFAILIAD
jgi:hypothetical protein